MKGAAAALSASALSSGLCPVLTQAEIGDDPQFEGDMPPFPADWPKEVPSPPPQPQNSLAADPNILREYRVIGCPVYACTQSNVNWRPGHYYSFAAPRTGTVSAFMWQTQGARQHADTDDEHAGGTFGEYTLKFYRTSWTGNKGSLLAQADLTQPTFNPRLARRWLQPLYEFAIGRYRVRHDSARRTSSTILAQSATAAEWHWSTILRRYCVLRCRYFRHLDGVGRRVDHSGIRQYRLGRGWWQTCQLLSGQ